MKSRRSFIVGIVSWVRESRARRSAPPISPPELRQVERYHHQLCGQVDLADEHAFHGRQTHRGEVEDALDAPLDRLVRHSLRRFGRHRDDGNVHVVLTGEGSQLAFRPDDQPIDVGAHHAAGTVEYAGQSEPLLAEDAIAGESLTQLAGATYDHPPLGVQPQALRQLPYEELDLVADAPDSELAEVAEIFPDLCGVRVEPLRQLLRGDLRHAVTLQTMEHAEVPRETRHSRLRHLRLVHEISHHASPSCELPQHFGGRSDCARDVFLRVSRRQEGGLELAGRQVYPTVEHPSKEDAEASGVAGLG